MQSEALITLTAGIVAAHVSSNEVTPSAVPQLIETVFGAMASLGQSPSPREEPLVPAVSVRSSVKPSAIACLECGAKFKMLKRHLMTDHNLTPADYRARWNLNADYPLVAADYAAKRRELAVKNGLGRKRGPRPKASNGKKPRKEASALARQRAS